MRFHLYKASRSYQGRPYTGPSSDNMPAWTETLEEARQLQDRMTQANPVGWIIRDTVLNKDV